MPFKSWVVLVAAVGTCLVFPGTVQAVVSGVVVGDDNQPLSYAFVGQYTDGFEYRAYAVTDQNGAFTLPDGLGQGHLIVQPQAWVSAEGLGIYPCMPRTYRWFGEPAVRLVLPPSGCIVLEAYDASGSLMRWGAFQGLGTVAGQAFHVTDLAMCSHPASYWPVYDETARISGAQWNDGLPAAAVEPGAALAVEVLFWDVPGCGRLTLRADNAGQGYTVAAQGDAVVVELNAEFARTAVADLRRRAPALGSAAEPEIVAVEAALAAALAKSTAPARAAAADSVLASALALRDRLELEAARARIASVRRGTLSVSVVDERGRPVRDCAVRVTQQSHDFMFGVFDGTPNDTSGYERAREAGFEVATLLLGWGWTQKNGVTLSRAELDPVYGITALRQMGYRLRTSGNVWMQQYGILPEYAYEMAPDDVAAAALAHQQSLLRELAGDIDVWEAMNEPATTNAVGLSAESMLRLVDDSAWAVKQYPEKTALVNSGHELWYGGKHRVHGLDNQPIEDFSQTYCEFLELAQAAGALDHVDSVGLQLYPGYKLNMTMFDGQEGPAMAPSAIGDQIERYARFGRPVHITEFSVPSFYGEDWTSGYWREPWNPETQADFAEAVYTLAFANPSVAAITWWDVRDDNASIISGGLYDAWGRAKPAVGRIAGLIDTWTTKASRVTGVTGAATFAAFAGEYQVIVRLADGREYRQTAHVSERQRTNVTVRIEAAKAPEAVPEPAADETVTTIEPAPAAAPQPQQTTLSILVRWWLRWLQLFWA